MGDIDFAGQWRGRGNQWWSDRGDWMWSNGWMDDDTWRRRGIRWWMRNRQQRDWTRSGDWEWRWDRWNGGRDRNNSIQITNNGWETIQLLRDDGSRVINLAPGDRVRLRVGVYWVLLQNGNSFRLPHQISSISLNSSRRRYRQ